MMNDTTGMIVGIVDETPLDPSNTKSYDTIMNEKSRNGDLSIISTMRPFTFDSKNNDVLVVLGTGGGPQYPIISSLNLGTTTTTTTATTPYSHDHHHHHDIESRRESLRKSLRTLITTRHQPGEDVTTRTIVAEQISDFLEIAISSQSSSCHAGTANPAGGESSQVLLSYNNNNNNLVDDDDNSCCWWSSSNINNNGNSNYFCSSDDDDDDDDNDSIDSLDVAKIRFSKVQRTSSNDDD